MLALQVEDEYAAPALRSLFHKGTTSIPMSSSLSKVLTSESQLAMISFKPRGLSDPHRLSLCFTFWLAGHLHPLEFGLEEKRVSLLNMRIPSGWQAANKRFWLSPPAES